MNIIPKTEDLEKVLTVAKRQKALLFTLCIYFMVAGLIYTFSDSLELTSTELKFLSQFLLLPIVLAKVIFYCSSLLETILKS